jgi:hypothetical protein
MVLVTLANVASPKHKIHLIMFRFFYTIGVSAVSHTYIHTYKRRRCDFYENHVPRAIHKFSQIQVRSQILCHFTARFVGKSNETANFPEHKLQGGLLPCHIIWNHVKPSPRVRKVPYNLSIRPMKPERARHRITLAPEISNFGMRFI